MLMFSKMLLVTPDEKVQAEETATYVEMQRKRGQRRKLSHTHMHTRTERERGKETKR